MRKLGMMVLILFALLTMKATNYAFAQSQEHSKNRATPRFDAIDTNNDGKISHDEFMAKSEDRFKAMDTDNDGFVSREEAEVAWKKKREKKK